MSEQSKILAQIHALVMEILKTGTVSEEEGAKIDALEELLHKQNCYKELENSDHACQGEEIASLFFEGSTAQAIDKMIEYEITPEDFFGFVQYHYDEEHEDEDKITMFTGAVMAEVNEAYESKV